MALYGVSHGPVTNADADTRNGIAE